MNELIQLASDICETPIGLVSLLTADRQVVMSSVGTDLTETPIEVAFCAHTVEHADLFVVEDASRDVRFQGNSLVTGETHIRFYAGIPLRWPDGGSRGALCVIDRVARTLSDRQANALRTLARQVELQFELEAKQARLELALEENAKLSTKLQETNRLFSAFMSHAPFLCYVKDVEGRFRFYNKNFAEQFGVSEEAWLGKRDHDVFPSEWADEYRRHDQEVMARGEMQELFERTPGEGENHVQWKSYKFPITLADGTMLLAGISIDFTETLEREERLLQTMEDNLALSKTAEASKNMVQGFLDNAPFSSYMKTTDGAFTSYNQVFAKQFGITATEWVGRSTGELFPEAEAARFATHDEELLRRGEPLTSIYRTPDLGGAEKTFRETKFILASADGSALIGGVVQDISADAELAEQRERMAALGTMAGGMAHEINNPLAIIHVAAADLLDELRRDEPSLREMEHCAGDVLQTVMRIKKIVESMRSLSRDGTKDKPAECTVESIVEATVELSRQRFRNSSVRLEVGEVDPELRIVCQQAQLGQVLLNLVMNAFDAVCDHKGSGWVRVGADVRAGGVIFSVTDSGAGVPEELKARIMEPFFTTKDVGKGTGLGLSISRTIVAEHGGMLALTDEGGHTCFSFQIPHMEGGAVPCN